MATEDFATTIFAVVDTETTGLDPRYDRVVEIACLRMRGGEIVDRLSSLVDPQRAIPARATAVHGIVDRDVANAPTLAALEARIRELARDAVVVAHNARFDLGFLPFIADRPSICTMQFARRVVDAPNYRNETLRAFLRLERGAPPKPAHRAEGDAETTAALLVELLRRYANLGFAPDVGELRRMLANPRALARLPFGMHRGRALGEIPTGYLRWIARSDFENWPDVRHSALLELGRRSARPTSPRRAPYSHAP